MDISRNCITRESNDCSILNIVSNTFCIRMTIIRWLLICSILSSRIQHWMNPNVSIFHVKDQVKSVNIEWGKLLIPPQAKCNDTTDNSLNFHWILAGFLFLEPSNVTLPFYLWSERQRISVRAIRISFSLYSFHIFYCA